MQEQPGSSEGEEEDEEEGDESEESEEKLHLTPETRPAGKR